MDEGQWSNSLALFFCAANAVNAQMPSSVTGATIETAALMSQAVAALVARDFDRAQALITHASDAGDQDAALMQVALTANGSVGVADWGRACGLLRKAAQTNVEAREQLALIEGMAISEDGQPTRLPPKEKLTGNGAVVRLRGFLTREECEHIAQAANDMLEPAIVVDPRTGRQIRHPHRTSDGAVIGPTRETLPIRAINQRIAAASGTVVEQGEALTVLRYRPGQQYRPHFDTLPGARNQRVITMLLYLNEGFGGGETVFADHGLSVRPQGGDALLFTNTLSDGRPDPRSRHAGAPVVHGSKWLATRWIRARPFDVWAGPEAV